MEVIHSNRVVLPSGVTEAFLLIADGKFRAVENHAAAIESYPFTELGDQLVMPGVIDPHVHINEPGRTEWEGFDTATKAAIAGGITTLVDMPLNASPVTTTVDAFDQKLAATSGKLHTNLGFWGGIVPGNDAEVEGLVKKGVLGFKAFLTHSGIDEFPKSSEEELRRQMPVLAKFGLPLLVHCELTDNHIRATGNPRSYANYLSSRPKQWEDKAIALMIRLCEATGCRVHIVHLSSADSLEQISRAKQRGLPLTVETAQHYLCLTAEQVGDGQTVFKCAPPIREKENNQRLWEALEAGIIDLVATDHSPCIPSLKEPATGNFLKAWGGIASLQLALPLLWTATRKKGLAFSPVVKWLCEEPARLIGKEHCKGKIEKGFDADFVVFDPEGSFTVTESMLFHRHKQTPYLHERLYGTVSQTYIAGTKVYDSNGYTQLNVGKWVLGRDQ